MLESIHRNLKGSRMNIVPDIVTASLLLFVLIVIVANWKD